MEKKKDFSGARKHLKNIKRYCLIMSVSVIKKENMYNLCHQEQVSVAAQTQKEWLKGRINTKIDEGLKHVVLKKQTNALKWSVMWFNMLWTSVTPPQKKMVYSLFLPQIYSEQVCFPAYAT